MSHPPSLLHICNGHATSRPLEESGVPGTFKLFIDVLLEGPCPPLWGDAWRKLRMDVLTGPGGFRGPGAPEAGEDLWDDDIALALSPAGGFDEIVLWYEHDLYDQLLLIRLLASIARHHGPRPALSLVCIGEHPEVPKFRGLGQLTPNQLASLFQTRSALSDATIALGRDAWTAYTDPDPQQLEALLGRDLSALPFLARALRRHLEEYPGVEDGLSRSERTVLTLVGDGTTEIIRVWQQLVAGEDCHYMADSWLLRLVDRLTAPPAALLAIDRQLRLPLAPGQATLSLTPLGEKVLRARVDWLEHAGINRWLGGVHLDDPQTAWRWSPDQGIVAAPRHSG